ncbi:hypothetical protein HMI54_010709, partial [Coelomomyces lativittatus]
PLWVWKKYIYRHYPRLWTTPPPRWTWLCLEIFQFPFLLHFFLYFVSNLTFSFSFFFFTLKSSFWNHDNNPYHVVQSICQCSWIAFLHVLSHHLFNTNQRPHFLFNSNWNSNFNLNSNSKTYAAEKRIHSKKFFIRTCGSGSNPIFSALSYQLSQAIKSGFCFTFLFGCCWTLSCFVGSLFLFSTQSWLSFPFFFNTFSPVSTTTTNATLIRSSWTWILEWLFPSIHEFFQWWRNAFLPYCTSQCSLLSLWYLFEYSYDLFVTRKLTLTLDNPTLLHALQQTHKPLLHAHAYFELLHIAFFHEQRRRAFFKHQPDEQTWTRLLTLCLTPVNETRALLKSFIQEHSNPTYTSTFYQPENSTLGSWFSFFSSLFLFQNPEESFQKSNYIHHNQELKKEIKSLNKLSSSHSSSKWAALLSLQVFTPLKSVFSRITKGLVFPTTYPSPLNASSPPLQFSRSRLLTPRQFTWSTTSFASSPTTTEAKFTPLQETKTYPHPFKITSASNFETKVTTSEPEGSKLKPSLDSQPSLSFSSTNISTTTLTS